MLTKPEVLTGARYFPCAVYEWANVLTTPDGEYKASEQFTPAIDAIKKHLAEKFGHLTQSGN